MENNEKDQYVLYKISSFMSDNDKYNRLENSEKLDVIDMFYNDAFYDEQYKLLTISPFENRAENSELLNDIYQDDRFKTLDMLINHPDYQNSYISFETIAKKIFNVLDNEKNEDLNKENIEKAILPITVIIEIGGIDTQYQKNMLGIGLRNLDMYIATSENIKNKNEVSNIITTLVDETSYWREEDIFKKEKDIVERIIKDKSYSDKFPVETIMAFKDSILSYQNDDMKKIAEIVKEKVEPNNLLTKMLLNHDYFSKLVEGKKKNKLKMN